MPEKSGFFDSTADDIRSYPARDFAEYFSRFVTNGVFNGGNNLEVIASGNDANVQLKAGYAWINGYVYSVYDNPITLAIEPASTMDRIDRVIIRLDTSVPIRAIRAIVLQGAPNSNPTAPALVRSGNIYDLSLAQIRVKSNSTIIEQSNITDERLNEAVCGLVNSLIRVDTATFQRQWDEFIQSIQNSGFATTQYVDSKANAAETNAKNYVDGKTWQKYKMTTDTGTSIILTGETDLNNIRTTGFYDGSGLINAPGNGWYYIEVQSHSSNPGAWTIQKAHDFNSNTYYQRTCTNGAWSAWQELFQSVANGKQAIATAISGKGISASGSDEFAVLANKISQIPVGVKYATGNIGIIYAQNSQPVDCGFVPRVFVVSGLVQGFGSRAATYIYLTADGIVRLDSYGGTYLYITSTSLQQVMTIRANNPDRYVQNVIWEAWA